MLKPTFNENTEIIRALFVDFMCNLHKAIEEKREKELISFNPSYSVEYDVKADVFIFHIENRDYKAQKVKEVNDIFNNVFLPALTA